MIKGQILLVDDEPGTRLGVSAYLESYGYDVRHVDTCAATIARLKTELPDLVLLDYSLPDGNAIDVLRALKGDNIDVPVIVVTGHGSIELAVAAIKEGAEHFVTKPVDMASLVVMIDRALEHQQNTRRATAAQAREASTPIEGLFGGRSTAIRTLARDAQSVASCDTPVLIEGETGTGKGVLARWIYETSTRAKEAFVDLNCAGLSRELLESELFGYEKGAFTGAVGTKRGLIEAAHKGTMFLDEIGDTDLAVQPKLLKVIEEKRFRRLGDTVERRVDVRFVAATNRNLAQLVEDGKFRDDLYYRINTMVLRLPPLREHREDIPAIAAQVLRQLQRDVRRSAVQLDPDAEAALMAHSWPGNVRELRNVLERAVLLTASPVLRRSDLRLTASPTPSPVAAASAPAPATLKEMEWQQIERVLAEEGGNVPRAAMRLGIPRSTLYQKLKIRNQQTAVRNPESGLAV
ncbi:MAG TPA: sigma-54 dependent transcriptional regulator [Vicinamibacterales bacterium]|nr:sigma-54 dependent transcriptional regulator [Vicinamibacterales bacterium]